MDNNDELFKKYSANKNNIEVRNELVLNNLNLVPYTINKYQLYVEGIHDYEEMLQDGYISLIKAVENFDYTLGYKFSSYAIKYIRSLARERLDYNKDKSLNEPIENGEGEKIELCELIKDKDIDVETEVINKQFYLQVRSELFLNLDNLEYEVICSFFGIGQEEKTVNLIAKSLNLEYYQIVNIKRKAINKIKKAKFFRLLYKDMSPVTYYLSPKYDNLPCGSRHLNSPVERIVIEREKQEKELIKDTIKYIKSTL